MLKHLIRYKLMLLATLVAGSITVSTALAQAARGKEIAVANQPLVSSPSLSPNSIPHSVTAMPTNTTSGNRDAHLRRFWGVDNLEVRATSSGELLRFSYRVLDANRAKALNDKKHEPHLIDESSGYMLQVPSLEKVGQLRQTATPENGHQYWMVFANKGGFIKSGSRVDIIIGSFRVNGLVVDESAPLNLKQKSIN